MFANATRSTPAIQRNALSFVPGTYLMDNYRHMMGFVAMPVVDENDEPIMVLEPVMVPVREPARDRDGTIMLDRNGEVIFETQINWRGDVVMEYVHDEQGQRVYEYVPLTEYRREVERAFNPWLGFRNSLIVSIGVTLLAIYFSSLTAYANVAYDWKFKNALFAFIMFVLMIPTQLSVIGFFQFVHSFSNSANSFFESVGWGMTFSSNSFWPLILPAVASPAIVFFMRQYLLASLSTEIIESARIDGAKEFYTFNRIVLPLMKPALATQAIFVFVGSWNNLFMPMLLLRGNNRTMPVMVQLLRGDIYDTVLGAQYLGLAMTILPLFIVYFILSKYIIAGVALGSMKE
jgi:multiple sugar transport system permease protein